MSCVPRNASWVRFLGRSARRSLMRGEVSAKQLVLAEAKARKIQFRNRKNSICHKKGNNSKTERPGKGKHGFNISYTILEASGGNDDSSEDESLEYEVVDPLIRRRSVVQLAQFPYRHIVDRFWLGQRVEVASYGPATVTCLGGYKCCCGYSRSNKGIGVTYDDGLKYHCDVGELRPSEVSNSDISETSKATRYCPQSNSVFSIIATSLDGNEYHIPDLYPDMTFHDFKLRIATVVGTPARLLQIVNRGQNLTNVAETLGVLNLAGLDTDVTFFREQKDESFWNVLGKELFVAIISENTTEARYLISAFSECKGEFRLAHILRSAYISMNTLVANFLLENAPAEVLFQALVMKVLRNYSNSKEHRRMAPGGKPSSSLIVAMYFYGDFASLYLVGSRLTSKWRQCVRRQCGLWQAGLTWLDIEKHMNNSMTV